MKMDMMKELFLKQLDHVMLQESSVQDDFLKSVNWNEVVTSIMVYRGDSFDRSYVQSAEVHHQYVAVLVLLHAQKTKNKTLFHRLLSSRVLENQNENGEAFWFRCNVQGKGSEYDLGMTTALDHLMEFALMTKDHEAMQDLLNYQFDAVQRKVHGARVHDFRLNDYSSELHSVIESQDVEWKNHFSKCYMDSKVKQLGTMWIQEPSKRELNKLKRSIQSGAQRDLMDFFIEKRYRVSQEAGQKNLDVIVPWLEERIHQKLPIKASWVGRFLVEDHQGAMNVMARYPQENKYESDYGQDYELETMRKKIMLHFEEKIKDSPLALKNWMNLWMKIGIHRPERWFEYGWNEVGEKNNKAAKHQDWKKLKILNQVAWWILHAHDHEMIVANEEAFKVQTQAWSTDDFLEIALRDSTVPESEALGMPKNWQTAWLEYWNVRGKATTPQWTEPWVQWFCERHVDKVNFWIHCVRPLTELTFENEQGVNPWKDMWQQWTQEVGLSGSEKTKAALQEWEMQQTLLPSKESNGTMGTMKKKRL